jgi:hypothetical protein
MQIATQHSETVGEGSRIGVEKWLLLDGIALHSGNITPGNVKRATVIETNFADARLAIRNWATVTTGIAAHTIAIHLLPKSGVALADALTSSQNVA